MDQSHLVLTIESGTECVEWNLMNGYCMARSCCDTPLARVVRAWVNTTIQQPRFLACLRADYKSTVRHFCSSWWEMR